MTSTEHRHEQAGLRPTKQRLAVAAALAETEGFHSAQEIHELLGRRGTRSGWPRSTAPCSGSPRPARST
jgi:Fur family ferric uptake transcriptional regulator